VLLHQYPKVRKQRVIKMVKVRRVEMRIVGLKLKVVMVPKMMMLMRTRAQKDSQRRRRKRRSYLSGTPTRTWILSLWVALPNFQSCYLL
jgi:hypothetical protein